MSLRAQLMELRPEILRIAAEHGARNVRLFGSVARGEDGPASDIDLLVTFDPDRSLMDHAALVEALQSLLGRPVEIASERGIKPRYRQRILAEAVAL
jgi:predicted nucleotidyltransferase